MNVNTWMIWVKIELNPILFLAISNLAHRLKTVFPVFAVLAWETNFSRSHKHHSTTAQKADHLGAESLPEDEHDLSQENSHRCICIPQTKPMLTMDHKTSAEAPSLIQKLGPQGKKQPKSASCK